MPRRRTSSRLPFGLHRVMPRLTARPRRGPRPGPKRRPAVAAAPQRAPTGRAPRRGRWLRDVAAGRSYDVYLPAGRHRRTRMPLVVLLHGCRQTAAEFAAATRFTATADRNGFVLALPHQEQRHHLQRCWRWYEIAHQHRGRGEPAALAAIVAQVVAEDVRWRIDPRRVYVAGLSAGGAMALTLAATYPDVFAAAGVHSAPAYRSATGAAGALPAMAGRTGAPAPIAGDSAAMAPTVVVQGSADPVVRASNGDHVADQWLAYRAAAGPAASPVSRSRTTTGRTRDGRAYTTVRWYGARGRKVLEYWRVDGLGHAWSGGRDGGSFSDPRGPRAATLMWQFFRAHQLPPARAYLSVGGGEG